MKRRIAILLLICLCLGLAACSTKDELVPAASTEPAPAASTEPAQTTAAAPTESALVGDDWRTQRSYTEDIPICDTLTVCLSRLDDDSGYGVYDCMTGERIGTLLVPEGETGFFDSEPMYTDYDGDDSVDIGIVPDSGMVQWYGYNPSLLGTWPEDPAGAFRQIVMPDADFVDTTCFPFEEPDMSWCSEGAWAAYEEIYPKVVELEDFYYDVETYGVDYMEDLLDAFGIIKTLHPETRNYFLLLEDVRENDGVYDFLGMYSQYTCRWDPEESDDKDEIRTAMDAFEQKTEEILAGLNDDMTAYDKYYYLASVISGNASYDYEFVIPADEAPWAGVMGGMFICEGYSEAMEYLCRRANLYCKIVTGSSRGVSHAWNLVKVPSGTYHIDITWADEGGEPGSDGWMQYFMASQDMIELDHEILDGTIATGQ